MIIREIKNGASCSLWAIEDEGASDLVEFFIELNTSNPKAFTKINALLTMVAENGPPRNEEKCKSLKGSNGIFEFKTGDGIRVFWFWEKGKMIICSHAFHKKTPKTPKKQIKKAERNKVKYEEAKSDNSLDIIKLEDENEEQENEET